MVAKAALSVNAEAPYIRDMTGKAQRTLTSLQCRAARGALRWSVYKLADEASVSRAAVTRFEGDKNLPNPATLAALRQAFEAAGVQFLNGDGLRVKTSPAGKA
jgi:hypothetical protein